MSLLTSPRFPRNVLLVDAVSCLVCGALQFFLPDLVAALTGLGRTLVVGSGAFLLAYAAVVWYIATRDPLSPACIRALVFGNVAWAIACAALLFNDAAHASSLGVAYVVLQAVTVLLLADLQWFGLRRGAAHRVRMG